MRRSTIGLLIACGTAVTACGGGQHFANKPRPPIPVNLSVYVDDARVSVSPASVGAGPVVFIVTNAASATESLTIGSSGGTTLGTTGPINPQSTAQLTVDFREPGRYTLAARKPGATEASLALPATISAATIHIGKPRPSASNQLLQP